MTQILRLNEILGLVKRQFDPNRQLRLNLLNQQRMC